VSDRFANFFLKFTLLVLIIILAPLYFIGFIIETIINVFSPDTPESEHAEYYHRYL